MSFNPKTQNTGKTPFLYTFGTIPLLSTLEHILWTSCAVQIVDDVMCASLPEKAQKIVVMAQDDIIFHWSCGVALQKQRDGLKMDFDE